MSMSAAICFILISNIGYAIYEGYRKGFLRIIAPLIAFLMTLFIIHMDELTLLKRVPGQIYTDLITAAEAKETKLEPRDSLMQESTTIAKQFYGAALSPKENLTLILWKFQISYFFSSKLLALVFKFAFTSPNHTALGSVFLSMAGAILNGAISIIRIWIVMTLISLLASYISPIAEFQQLLFQSNVYTTIYFWNPLF